MSHDMITSPSAVQVKADGLYRVATANVCTLRPQEISTAVMEDRNISAAARISILERAFVSAQYDAVGVQESRHADNCVMRGEHYTIYSSAATKLGQGGVQLWLGHDSALHVVEHIPVSHRLMLVILHTQCHHYILSLRMLPQWQRHLKTKMSSGCPWLLSMRKSCAGCRMLPLCS